MQYWRNARDKAEWRKYQAKYYTGVQKNQRDKRLDEALELSTWPNLTRKRFISAWRRLKADAAPMSSAPGNDTDDDFDEWWHDDDSDGTQAPAQNLESARLHDHYLAMAASRSARIRLNLHACIAPPRDPDAAFDDVANAAARAWHPDSNFYVHGPPPVHEPTALGGEWSSDEDPPPTQPENRPIIPGEASV